MELSGAKLREQVWHQIDGLGDQLWDLALRIHSHPELGFEERQAAAWLTEALEQGGFQVERGVADLPTAFRATYPAQAPGARLAILAEYDALPELGHACGHNIIATIALGAGLGLAAVKDLLPGRLLVIGTPAEEGGGGKTLMIEAGLFREVDAAMMVHPSERTLIGQGSLAISRIKLTFQGKAAHASACPEDGINALDAVIQTFNGLNAMRQHTRDGARIHGIITDGGQKPNIVPERAAAEFYVRASENAYRDELIEKLRRCAEGAALAAGATFTFDRCAPEYKAMRSNSVMDRIFARHVADAGYPVESPDGGMGSTDMGDVSWEVPAIHAYVRIRPGKVAGHSREFAEAARSEHGRAAMLAGAKALAATCLDLWQQPDLMAQARVEFASQSA